MPLTALDERTALVLIDWQYGITWMLGPEKVAAPVAEAARLAAAFRAKDLPVFLVRVAFSPDGADRPTNRVALARPAATPPANWTEFVPELAASGRDIVISKRQTGAFYGTELDLQLRRRDV